MWSGSRIGSKGVRGNSSSAASMQRNFGSNCLHGVGETNSVSQVLKSLGEAVKSGLEGRRKAG